MEKFNPFWAKSPAPSPLDVHLLWWIIYFYKWPVQISDICLEIVLILCRCLDTESTVRRFSGAPETLANWQTDTECWASLSFENVFIWCGKLLSSYICHEVFMLWNISNEWKEQRNIANTHVSQIPTLCPLCFICVSKLKHSKLNRHPCLCFSKIPLPLSTPLPRGGHCPKVMCIFLAHVFTFLVYICSLCNIYIVLLIFMLYQKWYCHTVLIIFRFSSALYFGESKHRTYISSPFMFTA